MRYLRLTDPLALSERVILVPQPLVPVLPLLDGTRDLLGLQAAMTLRHKRSIALQHLSGMLDALDDAFLLENERFYLARASALAAYHNASFRTPTLAGLSYPDQPNELSQLLDRYLTEEGLPLRPVQGPALRALLSPHIDFQRGHAVYARVWSAAARSVQEADLVVILGTDHHSEGLPLSFTSSPYATPFGILPIPSPLLKRFTKLLGEEQAFAGELHHRQEHSIELAAVWLQYMRAEKPLEMLPILTGPLEALLEEGQTLASSPLLAEFVAILQTESQHRRILVVAAGDLSHVGPAFDGPPLNPAGRITLTEDDDRLLEWAKSGHAGGFYHENLTRCAKNNVCGSSPIYLALRILGLSSGLPLGYEVCPADDQNTSVVTIAGMGWI